MATGKRKTEAAAPAMVCEHCRHFKPLEGRNECRRYPPTMAVDFEDGGTISIFPLVDASEYCGEWAARLNS